MGRPSLNKDRKAGGAAAFPGDFLWAAMSATFAPPTIRACLMAKSTTAYVCQACGTAHAKWAGRCEACGAWNTLVEEAVSAPPGSLAASGGTKTKGAGHVDFSPLDSADPPPPRLS